MKLFNEDYIPPCNLAGNLKIFNYFKFFDDLFDELKFSKEELYFCMNSNEIKNNLLDDIHIIILNWFISDFKKVKWDEIANEEKRLLLLLCKSYYKNNAIIYNLKQIWPLFLLKLFNIGKYKKKVDIRAIEYIKEGTNKNYYTLSYEKKLNILENLILISYELNIIKENIDDKTTFLNEKLKLKDEFNLNKYSLVDTKKSLNTELTTELNNLKIEESKEEINQKTINKLINKTNKLKTRLVKTKENIKMFENNIKKEFTFMQLYLNNCFIIGRDNYGFEYIYFQYFPNCLYCREISNNNIYIINDIDKLEYLINQLLDKRGIKQKKLITNINILLEINLLELPKNILEINYDNITLNCKNNLSSKNSIFDLKDINNYKNLNKTFLINYFQNYVEENIEKDFNPSSIIEGIKFLEQIVSKHLGKYDIRWGDQKLVLDFYKRINEEEDANNIKCYLIELENNFRQFERVEKEENSENEDEDLNDNTKNKIILDDNSDYDIDFKKNRNKFYMYEVKYNNYISNKIKRKVWGFYCNHLRSNWIEFTNNIQCVEGLYISLSVLSQFTLYFTQNIILENDDDYDISRIRYNKFSNDIITNRTKKRILKYSNSD